MDKRHNSKLSPSNTMLVPYRHRQRHRDLAVTPHFTRFRLPLGWGVEEVPRLDGSRSDTYYYEPGSGRKFRSRKDVERYLNGDEYFGSGRRLSPRNHVELSSNSTRQRMLLYDKPNSENRRMIVSGGKLLRLHDELSKSHLAIVPSIKAAPRAPFILPDGWIVEEVPRKDINFSDKYYYEPGTGRKFRSLVSVEKYLAELDENAPLSKALEEIKENKKPLSKNFKLENYTKNSTPRKKNISGENNEASSFNSPPMKVKWVIASPQGDVFNPFIAETLIPDSVKQQWTDRFMILMNDGISNFPSSSG
ncbi:hypothetical protein BUALT_Bualt02G0059700 [Buddleja alternifolia]|uniref:MBD domain-containing protein n=1 Tax=Buddleja alternifolia TaxID=168488 RepID=A0AAV6XYC2_9LAMI|nr:hypothetical protein BUALT_Bualt02G0059700 [Buddleja alternifolia]